MCTQFFRRLYSQTSPVGFPFVSFFPVRIQMKARGLRAESTQWSTRERWGRWLNECCHIKAKLPPNMSVRSSNTARAGLCCTVLTEGGGGGGIWRLDVMQVRRFGSLLLELQRFLSLSGNYPRLAFSAVYVLKRLVLKQSGSKRHVTPRYYRRRSASLDVYQLPRLENLHAHCFAPRGNNAAD